jgi:hypothetical protein
VKLATFIDGIINYHNIEKKIEKLSAAAVFATAKKGVQKRRHFS